MNLAHQTAARVQFRLGAWIRLEAHDGRSRPQRRSRFTLLNAWLGALHRLNHSSIAAMWLSCANPVPYMVVSKPPSQYVVSCHVYRHPENEGRSSKDSAEV